MAKNPSSTSPFPIRISQSSKPKNSQKKKSSQFTTSNSSNHQPMAKAFSTFHGRTTFLGLSRSNHPNSSSLCYKPLVLCMSQMNTYVANIETDIEIHLKKTIQIKPPIDVYKPMHYLTFAAPKSTAPALCIAACELLGGDRDQAMAAASAVHLIHAAAYTHEHLPLSDSTRPKPLIEHKFKPNIELLTGDGIMPFGFELLARSMDSSAQKNADLILRVIIEITKAAGSQGIVDGQYRELGISDSEIDMDLIEYVCKKKDGELHACGAACGAILGGGSEEEIEKLRKYGLYVGMVRGLVHGVGRNRNGVRETVEKLRGLAMEELGIFKMKKLETISSFLRT